MQTARPAVAYRSGFEQSAVTHADSGMEAGHLQHPLPGHLARAWGQAPCSGVIGF